MSKNILVAPLNWGLGHATRCVPIIQELLNNGFNPIIASDGVALALLKKEFPDLIALELPSYNIEYSRKGENFKWKLLKNSPKTIKGILSEQKIIEQWIKEYQLIGVISDNRLGLFTKKVPAVFITHQLRVLSGQTTWLTSFIHSVIIKKYKECWVPDAESKPNLSGKLGHIENSSLNIKYLGVLSRLNYKKVKKKYDVMVLLSGPEPQRTMLEEKLLVEFNDYSKKVVFIKGKVEAEQIKEQIGNITVYNYMQSAELEKTINESEMVLSRSGYTTVMDLAKLKKKAFFIPTPGQFEQEYLAIQLSKDGLVPTALQDNFSIKDLESVSLFGGLPEINTTVNWSELFSLFKSERKL
jgi:uncharacterized protein (TIGR00661 family)